MGTVRPCHMRCLREELREPRGQECWALVGSGGASWKMGPCLGRPPEQWAPWVWRLCQQRGLSAQALTGTFITHSCAVLGPTDCGKPIRLQEVES